MKVYTVERYYEDKCGYIEGIYDSKEHAKKFITDIIDLNEVIWEDGWLIIEWELNGGLLRQWEYREPMPSEKGSSKIIEKEIDIVHLVK